MCVNSLALGDSAPHSGPLRARQTTLQEKHREYESTDHSMFICTKRTTPSSRKKTLIVVQQRLRPYGPSPRAVGKRPPSAKNGAHVISTQTPCKYSNPSVWKPHALSARRATFSLRKTTNITQRQPRPAPPPEPAGHSRRRRCRSSRFRRRPDCSGRRHR